jgi:hypothetical protein
MKTFTGRKQLKAGSEIQLLLNLKAVTLECVQQRVQNYNTKIKQKYACTV